MKWNDIAGLGDAKELLRENIALPLALPELFTGIRRPVKVPAAHQELCDARVVSCANYSGRQGGTSGSSASLLNLRARGMAISWPAECTEFCRPLPLLLPRAG